MQSPLKTNHYYDPIERVREKIFIIWDWSLGSFCYNHASAEVNLAWWLAWTSNPVVVHRKVGWVGSIPMHLRQKAFPVPSFPFPVKTAASTPRERRRLAGESFVECR